MAGVDLNLFTFDYDLTFAALLMNADGTVYHRYGTRDAASATGLLSMASLVRLLRETLDDHRVYMANPAPPVAQPRRTVEQIPTMARKIEERKRSGKKPECVHCHMVNGETDDTAREEKKFSLKDVLGRWPVAEKVGLTLDVDDPALVRGVRAGSAAAASGLRAGDRLLRLGSQRLRSQADVGWVLHSTPTVGGEIALEYLREGDMAMLSRLELKPDWNLANEQEFSWRSSMWGLRPQPGFGGQALSAAEREKLGLPADGFALKVGYIVDWGNDAATGRSVHKAGLRKGDVVLAVGGKKDFHSELHFQSWFRFTQKPGTRISIELWRQGERKVIEVPVLE